MKEVMVRTAVQHDLTTLLIFEQGVIAAERPFDSTLKSGPINYYDIEKMIAAEDVELVVAVHNNEIIGSGYARIENSKPYCKHAKYAYLGFMFVQAQYRGKGINQLIIQALIKWATLKNITEVRLDVYQNNDAAIRAYQKVGFTKHMVEMRMEITEI